MEVGTDNCHGNAENHEEQINDVLEIHEKNVKAESGPKKPLQQSARKRHMPLIYFDCYLSDS